MCIENEACCPAKRTPAINNHKRRRTYTHYVYILKSQKEKNRFYTGITSHLEKRLKEHNQFSNDGYTQRYAPWDLETYIVFRNENSAKEFELYLKTHSGRAFLQKRFIS